jgi:hypothetical protein
MASGVLKSDMVLFYLHTDDNPSRTRVRLLLPPLLLGSFLLYTWSRNCVAKCDSRNP